MKISKFIAMVVAIALFIIASPNITLATENLITITMYQVDSKGIGEEIGKVKLIPTDSDLFLKVNLRGLTPGKHGFHMHQNPSCEAKDGVAAALAGGHYDPDNTGKHEGPEGVGHLGDLPVLYANQFGQVKAKLIAPRLQAKDLSGHALIVHANGDNFSDTPQPLGGGGGRVACGVIE